MSKPESCHYNPKCDLLKVGDERNSLRAEVERLKAERSTLDADWEACNDRVIAYAFRLRDALERYAHHDKTCNVFIYGDGISNNIAAGECDCGLARAVLENKP